MRVAPSSAAACAIVIAVATAASCRRGPPESPRVPGNASPAAPQATARVPDSCSDDGWCWENPLPSGFEIEAVWGSTARDVWAVGAGGVILRWNGSAWSRARGITTSSLHAIWGQRSYDVWAAGDAGTLQGSWKGASITTGHPLEGLLKRYGWYGKRFESPEGSTRW